MDLVTRREILGAYHVATFPGWRAIVEAQGRRLVASGLLARTEKVLVGVVGEPDEDLSPIVELLGGRAEVRRLGPLGAYEFPTLQWLHDEAADGDRACWYMHTKGVSNGCAAGADHRGRMEALIVDNHAACLDLLDAHDACGGFWRDEAPGAYPRHFSGNFWWANARYLRTLPPPDRLDLGNRYEAEFWIGRNPDIRPFGLVDPADPFAKPSAWRGLEWMYRDLLGDMEPVRRVVDLGVDYGFSTFHFAKDFPIAEVIGVDNFTLHDDAEAWVRSHQGLYPNVRIVKGSIPELGRAFRGRVDLLHIDAYHDFASVTGDFCAWLHAVREGGRVLFHDTESFPDIRKFFDGLGGTKREIRDHHGLGCWIKE